MFTGLLNQKAVVWSKTITPDTYGGESTTHAIVYGCVPCRIRQLNAPEKDVLMRLGVIGEYKLYCDARFKILNNYLVVAGGAVYEVVSASNDVHFIGHHNEIHLKRLEESQMPNAPTEEDDTENNGEENREEEGDED